MFLCYRGLFSRKGKESEDEAAGWKLFGKVPPKHGHTKHPDEIQTHYKVGLVDWFHVGNIVKVISKRSVYLTSIHRFTSTSLLIPKLIRLLWVTTELDSAFYAFPMKWQWALSLIAPVPPSVCASVRLKFSWMQFLLHH